MAAKRKNNFEKASVEMPFLLGKMYNALAKKKNSGHDKPIKMIK